MRTFFALDLPAQSKLAIARWRESAFRSLEAGGLARPVPAANFHMTLAFIGELPQRKLEQLCDRVDALLGSKPCAAGIVELNEVGYWPRNGILWLGPAQCPGELQQLATRLRTLAGQAGGKRESKAFQPHISLFRRCTIAPPASLSAPEFAVGYAEITLFESHRGDQGASYQPIHRWTLG